MVKKIKEISKKGSGLEEANRGKSFESLAGMQHPGTRKNKKFGKLGCCLFKHMAEGNGN